MRILKHQQQHLLINKCANLAFRPPAVQLLCVGPAEYQAWLRHTSRGKARFFASNKLEAVTKVQW